jgi:protein ImuA
MPTPARPVAEIVADLTERVRLIERPRQRPEGLFSSGHRRLDHLLPEGGFRRGTLVEWLAAGRGSGAGTLALVAARQAALQGGAIVVIDPDSRFYPPGAIQLGIDLEQLIVVRPTSDEDHAWATDQALRTRGVAAVWCTVPRQDDHTLRRWQLAAETTGALGLLLRPEVVRHDPSWAELRLLVEPLVRTHRVGRARQQRVTLVRSRSGHSGRMIELELPMLDALGQEPLESTASRAQRGLGDETRIVSVASRLAPATPGRHTRRA